MLQVWDTVFLLDRKGTILNQEGFSITCEEEVGGQEEVPDISHESQEAVAQRHVPDVVRAWMAGLLCAKAAVGRSPVRLGPPEVPRHCLSSWKEVARGAAGLD